MHAIWLTPGPAVRESSYAQLAREAGWRQGPAFPWSENEQSETLYLAPDGTRIVIYHPSGGMLGSGSQAIGICGPSAAEIAHSLEGVIAVTDRRTEPVFHRFDARHTAACAGDGGVWFVDSVRGELLWRATYEDAPKVIAAGLHSAFALAGGEDGLFVVTCDEDPAACRLARVEPATGAVTWLPVSIDRAAQLAMVGGVVHVACAAGLVRIDAAGAAEVVPLDAPLPRLLGAWGHTLTWIDASGSHVVAFDGARAEVLASADKLIALDVDGERAYAMTSSGRVLECRRGRPPREYAFEQWRAEEYAGILRLGPALVTTTVWDSSWFTRTQCESLPIGFPCLDEAPAELRAQLDADADAGSAAWEVLSDWLAERGVRATPEQLRAGVDLDARDSGYYDYPGGYVGSLAIPLVTFDREVGYRVQGTRVAEVLHPQDYYTPLRSD